MTLREAVGACMSPVDASAAISMSTGPQYKTNKMKKVGDAYHHHHPLIVCRKFKIYCV